MAGAAERREFYRVDKTISVRCCKVNKIGPNKYARANSFSAEAVNFGGSGLLLKVGEPSAVGDYLLVEISLPSDRMPVKALGQVMRFLEKIEEDVGKYFLGVRFMVIDETERDRLMKAILSEAVKEDKPEE